MRTIKSIAGNTLHVLVILILLFNTPTPATALASPHVSEESPQGMQDVRTTIAHNSNSAETSLYPAPIVEPTASPTEITESSSPLAASVADDKQQITLQLRVTPEYFLPNQTNTLSWVINGLNTKKTEKLVLQIKFPDGIVPEVDLASSYEASTGILKIPTEKMRGTVQITASSTIDDVVIEAILYSTEKQIASTVLTLGNKDAYDLNRAGGEVRSQDGRIKVKFPSGILKENILLELGSPSTESTPAYSLSGSPFEIKAFGKDSKKNLTKFSDMITIEVGYAELNIDPQQEENLFLYWYNPEVQEWAALPTIVDQRTKTIKGKTDHFTVFDIGVNNWQASHTPTIESFQVSEFTGAGTYSMPIEVPPGPGGLQPNLALNYNSQIVDQADFETQASWVGMGWSLETGSIEVNTQGTKNYFDDDMYFLNVNGVSTRIVRDPSGTFHAENENFWKISFSANDTWTVQDKSGNIYTFAYTSIMRGEFNQGSCRNFNHNTYQWSLTEVKNIYGQTITYEYEKEEKELTSSLCGVSYYIDIATYPTTITYSHGLYRVEFIREPRADYPSTWDTDGAPHQYQRERLQRIKIMQDADKNGSFETIIRSYDLLYGEDEGYAGYIFPNQSRSDGTGHVSTLRAVQQNGVNNLSSFPRTVFTYGDGLHLTKAINGYGGRVEFDYISYAELDGTTNNSIVEYKFGGGKKCGPVITTTSTSYWYLDSNSTVSTNDCTEEQDGQIAVHGRIYNFSNKSPYSASSQTLIRPGRKYRLTAEVTVVNPGTTWWFGIKDGVNELSSSKQNSIGTISQVFTLPSNGNKFGVYIHAQNLSNPVSSGIAITRFEIEALQTYYRVAAKKLYAADNSTPYIFNYRYSSPALNDPAHSEAASNCPEFSNSCTEYVEEYSQFRGHGLVSMTDPYGKTVETTYYQNDLLMGRPSKVEILSGQTLLSSTHFTYLSNSLPTASMTTPEGRTYVGVQRYFTYTSHEENRIYNHVGSFINSTATEYIYEMVYGNLKWVKEYANGNLYRQTENFYYYNPASTVNYLPGLTGKTRVYDAANKVIGITLYQYDGNTGSHEAAPVYGKLTAVRSLQEGSNFSQISYGYDAWGNTISQTVYSGYGTWNSNPISGAQTTTTVFDPDYHTYPISITNPLNQTTLIAYNYTRSVPTSETDPNGNTTLAWYDTLSRMTGLTLPLSGGQGSMTFDYPSTNPFKATITLRIDPLTTYTVERTYDGMGRIIQNNAGGIKTDFGYNAYGQITQQSMPYSGPSAEAYTTTSYDELGRPLSITTPGSSTTYKYNGLTTTITEPDTSGSIHFTVITNDVWGRVENITPPTGPEVGYSYDELGRMQAATRGGSTTEITYDYAGRKISMNDPDMGVWTYSYDALGNLKIQTDARNCVLNMNYDQLNRLTGKSSSGSCGSQLNTTYTYDQGTNGVGHRTSMTDASGSTTAWTYDARGRVIQETKNIPGFTPFLTSWTYNLANMPITMTYPDGEVLNYTYNSQMLLNSMSGINSYITSSNYDDVGRMTNRQLGNGLTQTYSYYQWDEAALVDNQSIAQGGRLKSTSVGTIQSLGYIYDAAGNIRTITDAIDGETQSFSYDSLNRLVSATATNGSAPYSETYGYNNLTGNLENKGGVSLEYNDPLHRHAATNAGGNTYSYDSNGNMVSRAVNDQTFSLVYDEENRLIGVNIQGGQASRSSGSYLALPIPQAGETNTPTASPTPNETATTEPIPTETPVASPTPTTAPQTFTLSLQPNATDGADVYIIASSSSNYGTASDLGVGEKNNATGSIGRSLIKFDLSSIPANATITSATLSLWTSQDLSDTDALINVYRLKTPFNETQATWNNAASGVSWQTAGASGANDRESTSIGSASILANEPLDTEKQILFDPAKIQEMVNGTFANNGFIIVSSIELNDRFMYRSSDSGTTTQRPKLVIQYTLGGPTPTATNAIVATPTSTETPVASPTPTTAPQTFTLSLQPNATDGADVYIIASSSSNYGTASDLGVGEKNNATGSIGRSLIKFDLSSIPANATITSATLSLWTSQDLSDTDALINVYRLKTPFNETQATWNNAASGVSWQTAGASGANDRESTSIGSASILANEPLDTEKQILFDPAKIQEMVNGTFANNGFIIVSSIELNDRFMYRSSDSGTTTQRPKLVIQYTLGGPTPTAISGSTSTPTITATTTHTPTPAVTAIPTNTSTPTPPPAPVFASASFTYDGDGKRVKSVLTTNLGSKHHDLCRQSLRSDRWSRHQVLLCWRAAHRHADKWHPHLPALRPPGQHQLDHRRLGQPHLPDEIQSLGRSSLQHRHHPHGLHLHGTVLPHRGLWPHVLQRQMVRPLPGTLRAGGHHCPWRGAGV
jgi:YD repeat-containing protein